MKSKVCFLLLCSALGALILSGCSKQEDPVPSRNPNPNPPPSTGLAEYEKINKFIIDGVQTFYLWEAETDWKQYNSREKLAVYDTDHERLFNRLRYKDDKWSLLTDDIRSLENEFAGISTTFGYALQFFYHPFVQGEVIAVVLYTSKDSPASVAGLKRGDVIVEMDGAKITANNYLDLYFAPALRLRCGQVKMDVREITPLPETVDLVAEEMYEDPVHTVKIIDVGGRKIGYMCYMGYTPDSEKALIREFSTFKSEGVEDVVLDLRYNSGGYAQTALLLSSILAPENVVRNEEIFLEHHYNALLESVISQEEELHEVFVNTVSVNMNLSRLYVLTSERTASASEATIVGLEPYMDIIQIGDSTSGKYCGGILLSPEGVYEEKTYYSDFADWGMYIMIYRFSNKKGISSFMGRLAPTIKAEENPFNLKPFGDEDDPLLGRAIAHILGVNYVEQRSAKITLPLSALPDPKRSAKELLIASPPPLKK